MKRSIRVAGAGVVSSDSPPVSSLFRLVSLVNRSSLLVSLTLLLMQTKTVLVLCCVCIFGVRVCMSCLCSGLDCLLAGRPDLT